LGGFGEDFRRGGRGLGNFGRIQGDQDALREGISGNMGQQVVGVHGKYREKYMVWFLTSV